MGRPCQALNAIINGHKTITADTAIELGDAFGTSAVYWLNLQTAYQLYLAHLRRTAALSGRELPAARKKVAAKKGLPSLSEPAKKKVRH